MLTPAQCAAGNITSEIEVTARLISDSHSNGCHVVFPKKPLQWMRRIQSADRLDNMPGNYLSIGVGNLGNGCSNCLIGIFPPGVLDTIYSKGIGLSIEEGKGLGIFLNKETLIALKRAIDFTLENFK